VAIRFPTSKVATVFLTIHDAEFDAKATPTSRIPFDDGLCNRCWLPFNGSGSSHSCPGRSPSRVATAFACFEHPQFDLTTLLQGSKNIQTTVGNMVCFRQQHPYLLLLFFFFERRQSTGTRSAGAPALPIAAPATVQNQTLREQIAYTLCVWVAEPKGR